MTMTLKDYARAIRYHDWSACMSDSGAVARRGAARKRELAGVASEGKGMARLWALGSAWHGAFTWRGPSEYKSEEARFEDGWRWVGAYLYAHGVPVTEAEAKLLVEPLGSKDKWDRYTTGAPKWALVDLLVKVASK